MDSAIFKKIDRIVELLDRAIELLEKKQTINIALTSDLIDGSQTKEVKQ